MDPTLQQYVRLTEIDALIVATRDQLDAYPRMLAAMDEGENAQRAIIADARARAEDAARDRRAAEKEILDLRDKIRKYTSQQGAVKTNKEYEALTHEIDRIRAGIDVQETVGLEKLTIEEGCATRLAEAESHLARLGEQHAAERHRIDRQVVDKRERLERLQAERADAAAGIDPEPLEEYESANQRNPGSACAAMDGDHCSGCGWQAVPHVRQAVGQGRLIRCEHCRRFLYARS